MPSTAEILTNAAKVNGIIEEPGAAGEEFIFIIESILQLLRDGGELVVNSLKT